MRAVRRNNGGEEPSGGDLYEFRASVGHAEYNSRTVGFELNPDDTQCQIRVVSSTITIVDSVVSATATTPCYKR